MTRVTVAVLAVFMSAPAGASDICWINQVHKTDAGMELTFDHGNATVRRGGQTVSGAVQGGPSGSIVRAVIGDEVSVFSLHSDCTIDIVVQDGRPGARVHATAYLPGLPPNEADAFVPASD